MNFKHYSKFIYLVFFSISFHTEWSFPSCGVDKCPINLQINNKKPFSLILKFQYYLAGFNIEQNKGVYNEWMPSVHIQWKRLNAALIMPLILLNNGDHIEFGAGNLVLYSGGRYLDKQFFKASAGIQVEFPTGNSDEGMASDHFELMPYLTLDNPILNRIFINNRLGIRFPIGNSDENHHNENNHVLLVNPHSELELVWRSGISYQFKKVPMNPGLFIKNIFVFDHDDDVPIYSSAGVTMEIQFKKNIYLEFHVSAPITRVGRFQWLAGIMMKKVF